MNYTLNDNININRLKKYGFQYNGLDYIYSVDGYFTYAKNQKIPIITITFLINMEEKIFKYDVLCNDGSIYHHFYNQTKNNKVVTVINKILKKELNKMNKEGIIKMIDIISAEKSEINVKKINDNAILPTYGSENAAGADLYACIDNDVDIQPNKTVFIGTGIAVEIPDNHAGFIFARSSLSCKHGLAPANKVGVIDSDYRGEIMVALHNHSRNVQTVKPGERIAQIIIMSTEQYNFKTVDKLFESRRGDGGFGSTGK